MAVALERQDVRAQAIEEEAVVADHHRAAGEALQRLFERAQRFDVEVVGRSKEHTSELQSLMRISYAVFCLKKKTTPQPQTPNNPYMISTHRLSHYDINALTT